MAINQFDLKRLFRIDHSKLLCLLITILSVYGCSGTSNKAKQGSSLMDSGPSQPVDVSKVPDAVPKYEPRGKRGNAPSYVVWGKRYNVMKNSKNFVQRGMASWYGKKFHGRRTSNGEIYNMYAMTAAHKSLPLPSYLRVTNLRNGKSVVVRVNDRGPFHKNRIVDLSYSAAKKLDIIRTGTGYVEIQDISPVETATPTVNSKHKAANTIYVQIGAFANRANANNLANRVNRPKFPNSRIRTEPQSLLPLYRVQLGPIATIGEAHTVIDQLGKLGITTTRLITERTDQSGTLLQ